MCFFSQSHRLLFSHALVEVRGKNTPERKFISTGYRTQKHQVMCQTHSSPSHPCGHILLKKNYFVLLKLWKISSKHSSNIDLYLWYDRYLIGHRYVYRLPLCIWKKRLFSRRGIGSFPLGFLCPCISKSGAYYFTSVCLSVENLTCELNIFL